MRFFLRPFLPLPFLTLFSIIACRTFYSSDPLWNKVVNYFTNPSITREQIFSRMSPDVVGSVIGAYPVNDSIQKVVDFFDGFKNDHNYKVRRNHDTITIEFEPQKEIAGGPIIDIVDRDTSWTIIDIAFGK